MANAKRVQAGFVTVTEWLITALSAAVTLIIIYAVASRYLLGFSITWIEEIVRFLLAWIVFLGMSVLLYHRGHMAMEAIFQALSPAVQDMVRIGFGALILIFLSVVAYAGTGMALSALTQVSPVSGVSYFWAYLSLPIGSALGVIQVIFFLVDDVKRIAQSGSRS